MKNDPVLLLVGQSSEDEAQRTHRCARCSPPPWTPTMSNTFNQRELIGTQAPGCLVFVARMGYVLDLCHKKHRCHVIYKYNSHCSLHCPFEPSQTKAFIIPRFLSAFTSLPCVRSRPVGVLVCWESLPSLISVYVLPVSSQHIMG